MIRSFGGRRPRIHPQAFVHPESAVIGDVTIGCEASIWPMAVLRGDVGLIRIGERSNVQDNAVVHCREDAPAVVGKGVTIGHGAIVHGSRIGDRCLIGMGAIVMEASLGAECLVGGGALVPAGARIPARSLVLGVPGKVMRRLTPEELRSLKESERSYVALMKRHIAALGAERSGAAPGSRKRSAGEDAALGAERSGAAPGSGKGGRK